MITVSPSGAVYDPDRTPAENARTRYAYLETVADYPDWDSLIHSAQDYLRSIPPDLRPAVIRAFMDLVPRRVLRRPLVTGDA